MGIGVCQEPIDLFVPLFLCSCKAKAEPGKRKHEGLTHEMVFLSIITEKIEDV